MIFKPRSVKQDRSKWIARVVAIGVSCRAEIVDESGPYSTRKKALAVAAERVREVRATFAEIRRRKERLA